MILETVNIRIICHPMTNYTRVKLNVFRGINLNLSEIWALLGYYAAYSANMLPTFRDNPPVPFSGVMKSKAKPIGCPETLPTFGDNLSVPFSRVMKSTMKPIGCPETPVRNYHCTLRHNPEDGRSRLLRGGSPQPRYLNSTCFLDDLLQSTDSVSCWQVHYIRHQATWG